MGITRYNNNNDHTNHEDYLGCLGRAYTGSLIYNAWTLAYCTVTLALNITLTSLIVWRLQQCKDQLQKTLGAGHGKHYNILTTVFIESAFLNVVCSALLLASAASNPVRKGMWGYFLTNRSTMTMYWLFDVWAAITPAVQVSLPLSLHSTCSSSHRVLFHLLFSGLLKLSHYLSRCSERIWRLE